MLIITGYYETLDLFRTINYCENLLSILDPDTPSLKSIIGHLVDHFWELRFHDIEEPDTGFTAPNYAHIEQIVRWANQCESQNGIILSGAGMGRSPAAALIAMCEWGFTPVDAVERLRNTKPLASPNRRMLRLYGKAELEEAVKAAGFYDEIDY